ncbi:hypothetical protein [Acinetobacter sp.]|jgi:hypothetical protein|uniref:hypothetical protein n=1 Tax=Acinetobacter sp. TaxID=472 RepID=UPI002839122E|nr:hypothetical protein [Acinetobacter sp.]MDR0236790.1 hypothetical protein [Acinetobacter sp.]
MKQNFVCHFLISFGVMLITAMLCSILQYHSAYDYFWFIILSIVSVSGLVFAMVFSIFQSTLKQSLLNTLIIVVTLSLYFVVLFYGFIHIKIDWQAISEGKAQLTLLQKFVKSELSFWLAFLVPFILSFLTYTLKPKLKFN